ncbi:MAG: glycosyl hydrolase [Bacteroidales bacterium]
MKRLFTLTTLFILALSSCTQNQSSNIKSDSVPTVWPEIKKEMHPWARWWWMGNAVDKENLERELTLFADAGIGGVEITPIYGAKGFESKYINFLSPQWMNMLKVTVQKGNSLGLGVDMNCGTGWPFGGPQINPENAAGKLVVQIYKIKAEQNLDKKIIVLDSLQQKLGAPLKALTAYGSKGEMLNIIDKVDENGNLNWRPKTDNWEIYAAFAGHTGQVVKRAAPGGEGLVLDHLSKDALKIYLKRFDDAFGSNQVGIRSFFNDSYEVYWADFSPKLFDEFQKRRGYDVRNFLRELVSKENSDQIARIRSDYRLTLAEMVYENFSVPWHQWVNSKGGLSRNQAHGFPGNILDIYANVDIPEPESFGINQVPVPGMKYYTIDTKNVPPDRVMMKFASSAANVLGKPFTSCETFTWLGEHFKIPLAHAKPEVEKVFLAGVNHVFFHGTTYSPEQAGWPGWLFYASTNFAPSNSWWPHINGLTEYITRCQSILQAGTADSEVLLYWPYSDVRYYAPPEEKLDLMLTIHAIPEWLQPTPFYKNAMKLMNGGYSIDFVSDMLLSRSEVKNGLVKVAPEGAAYQVLVVPQTDFMPVETFTNILKLAEQGATVILEKMPDDVPGMTNLVARRQQLKQMASSLIFVDAGNGIRLAKIGNGQIIVSSDVQRALQYKNIHGENLTASGLKFIRRDINGNKYYYLVNHTAQKIDTYIPLNVQAASVMILDPQTGNFGLAETEANDDKIKVRLQINPGNTLILQTSKEKILGNSNWKYIESEGVPIAVSGKWKLKFTNGGPVLPKSQTLTSLISWTTLFDENGRNFSGSGEYSTTLQLAAKGADDYVLDLGDVRESARVWVNGQDAGILWHVPFKVSIGQYLKQGKNTLRIEVANLMANRIIDLDKRKVEWRKFNEINFVDLYYKPFDASNWEPMASGLLGPVTITPIN